LKNIIVYRVLCKTRTGDYDDAKRLYWNVAKESSIECFVKLG
jgi:hypothetical protein